MKRKHYIVAEMIAVVLLFVIGATVMVPRFLESQNLNTPSTFPDLQFRKQILRATGIQPLDRLSRSDVLKITHLEIFSNNVSNLKGIKLLQNLVELKITHNRLTEMDLSGLSKLQTVLCTGNILTSINVIGCKNLQILDCSNNFLAELNATNLPNLTELNCSSNILTSIDLSGSDKLKRLECIGNQLKSLDVSQNPALKSLHCGDNQIAALDLTNNPGLTGLYCWENPLTALDVSHNLKLQVLNAHRCEISRLDLSNNKDLQVVLISENQLMDVPIIINPEKLRMLELEKNKFDCGDWNAIQQYKSVVPIYSYSPQTGMDPYECVN